MCFSFWPPEQLYQSQLEEHKKEKSDHMASASQIKEALEKQMESHREQHQKQLSELRQEIDAKQAKIDDLTE